MKSDTRRLVVATIVVFGILVGVGVASVNLLGPTDDLDSDQETQTPEPAATPAETSTTPGETPTIQEVTKTKEKTEPPEKDPPTDPPQTTEPPETETPTTTERFQGSQNVGGFSGPDEIPVANIGGEGDVEIETPTP